LFCLYKTSQNDQKIDLSQKSNQKFFFAQKGLKN